MASSFIFVWCVLTQIDYAAGTIAAFEAAQTQPFATHRDGECSKIKTWFEWRYKILNNLSR
jgi:hypothetical protein